MGGRYGRYWGRMYLVSFGSFVYIHWGAKERKTGLIWDRELYFIFAHDCAEEEDDEGEGTGEEE
jgi:hypothetical protein